MKRKNPCSPKLWRKFNPAEREIWTALYTAFSKKENFHGLQYEDCIQPQIHVIAHNLACEAIWALRGEAKKAKKI